MLLTLVSLLAFAPQGPSTAPVVINEYSNDDSGTDNLEFVEIYNRSANPVDISAWTLNGEEGGTGTANGVFTFAGLAGSMTTMINPGQHIVVGMAAVPNVNFIVTGALPGLVLENTDADGVTLRDNTGAVIDGVAWGYKAWTAAVPAWLEGHGLWGQYILFDAVGQPQPGFLTPQRWTSGYDSNINSTDFAMMQWTPGTANGSFQNLPLSFVENCDGTVGSILPNTNFSFLGATVFDPAAVTIATATVRTYPASPQGGNLARLQDPTGGGNVVQPSVVVGSNFMAEVYVYVTGSNPALTVVGQGESWAFGVSGTTNSYATATDVPGTYLAQASLCTGTLNTAPGATGLAWMAYVSPTDTKIYLVDADGGGPTPFTILAGPIVATPGLNDGWQRLRLRVSGGNFIANFGGNYGVDDGQRFTGTVAPRTGNIYIQYRECVATNANLAGLYIDRLEVYGALASSVTYSGTGSPTAFGTPVIGALGLPTVGNAGFQINATSMFPNGISILALDAGPMLPGIPVPGAQPTFLLYASPTFTAAVFNTGLGEASYALPIPPTNSLIGAQLVGQFFDLDPSLPYALPFGSSGGAQILIGNG